MQLCFSDVFLHSTHVGFVELVRHGYHDTAIAVVMSIRNCLYSVEIPIPKNITRKEDMARLMGQVKFRADKLHISKRNDIVKEWEAVQMPTYDWKKCFDAIEADVTQEM